MSQEKTSAVDDIYAAFDMNEDAEQKGLPVNYGRFVVTIARVGGSNDLYRKVLEQESKPVATALELKELPEHDARQLLYRVYARTIVKRWQFREEVEGVNVLVDGIGRDASGNVVEFTEKNVIALWTRRHELFLRIQQDASQMELFQNRGRESVAKN